MSLPYEYSALPKVSEDEDISPARAACHGYDTPRTGQPPEEEDTTESSHTLGSEQDPLVHSQAGSSAVLSRAPSTQSSNMTTIKQTGSITRLNSQTSRSNSRVAIQPTKSDKDQITNRFITVAKRAAQNVPEQRLQRKENLRQIKRGLSEAPSEDNNSRPFYWFGFVAKGMVWLAYLLVFCTFPITIIFCLKVIQEYERAVIFRLGRITKGGAWGPGLCFFLPCLDQVIVVDMRTLSFAVPPQEVLTRDSVTVSVDAAVYFRISSPVASVCNVEDVEQSSRLLAQTTLRNIIGTRSLNELLSEREAISSDMQSSLDLATEPWGVVVERVEIKDVRLPSNLQRAMAAEAEAFREARAKEIAADGERNAAVALKDASDTMVESPCAIQLRYLQTLNNIASGSGQNSTIIFPVPVDLMSILNRGFDKQQPVYQNIPNKISQIKEV